MEYHLLAFSLYTLILIYLKQMSQKNGPLQVETEISRKWKKSIAEAPICQTNMKLFVKFNFANSTIKIQKYQSSPNGIKRENPTI